MWAFNLSSMCLSILEHHSRRLLHTSLPFVVVNVRLFPVLKRVAARRSLRSQELYQYYYEVCIVLIRSDSSLLACGISTQCNIVAYFLASCRGERAPVSSIETCCCSQKPEKSRTLPILPQGALQATVGSDSSFVRCVNPSAFSSHNLPRCLCLEPNSTP
jgi:hypothetical protein